MNCQLWQIFRLNVVRYRDIDEDMKKELVNLKQF